MSAVAAILIGLATFAGCDGCGSSDDTASADSGTSAHGDGGSDGGADTGGADDTGYLAVDEDGDGYSAGTEDCDDSDASIHPAAEELPGDGIDQDCDGSDAGPVLPLGDVDHTWQGTYWSMAGFVLAGGADIDGDGVFDIVTGAPWEGEPPQYGTVNDCPNVIYAMSAGSSGQLAEEATAVIEDLEACVGTGKTIPGIGDLNSDGYDDIAIGIYAGGADAWDDGGHVAVYLGPLVGVLGPDDAETHIYSSWDDAFLGYSTAIHDDDGPGTARLLTGAPTVSQGRPGELYIWDAVASGTILSDTADVVVVGTEDNGRAGFTTDSSADFTGDGIADLVVSEQEKSAIASQAGSVFILEDSQLDGTVSLDEGVELAATRPQSIAGWAMDPVTDFDGDGHADLLVGAPVDPETDTRGGKVWLIHGPITASGALDDVAGATVVAEQGYEWLGWALSDAGDIDGDGLSEIALSAPRDYYYGADLPGKVYLFRGGLEGAHTGADADLVIQGEGFGDWAGGGLAGGFDATGDGVPDLVVGAPFVDAEDGRYGGKIYLLDALAEAL